MAANQYLLQWNQHLENFAENFSILRDQAQYVDCTLACEEGAVSAHRIVLAGCSTYLQELFAKTATPHPVIFLTNTHRSIVLLLLEFIYRGKAYVPQEKLGELLELGRQLRVKGLIRVNSPNVEALVNSISENLSRNQSNVSTATAVPEVIPNVPSVQKIPEPTTTCKQESENVIWTTEDSDETMSAINGEIEQLEKDLRNQITLTNSHKVDKPRKRGRPRLNNYYMRFKDKHNRAKTRIGETSGYYCLTSLDILRLGGYSKKFGTTKAIQFAWKKHKRNFRVATILRYEGLYTMTGLKKREQIDDSLDDLSKE